MQRRHSHKDMFTLMMLATRGSEDCVKDILTLLDSE